MKRNEFRIAVLAVCCALSASPLWALSCATDPIDQLYPSNHPWNVNITNLPVLSNSAAMVASIGASTGLHPDFGGNGEYGIPFIVVNGAQPYVPINFTAYGDESDPGPYPIPLGAPIEGGSASDGDRHVLAFNNRNRFLYELYRAFPQAGTWNADSGAIFDTVTNVRRPLGWTSADAAGLSVLAGLARYEEVRCGAINHALRFTVRTSRRAYIYPASHQAGSTNSVDAPAMGQRFRLRANYDISSFPPQARIILQALKTYGMIVADNGSNWYITGSQHTGWDDDDLRSLRNVFGSNFEAVDTAALQPPTDATVPTGPSSLNLSSPSGTQLNASWPAASDNVGVIGYRVTISPNSNFSNPLPAWNGAYMGPVLSTGIASLNTSTRYYVRVRAYDQAGNSSAGAQNSMVTGGGTTSPCDVNASGETDVSDVQLCANQAIGVVPCGSGDINQDSSCTVVDVQRVVNAALGGQCVSS